MPDGPSVSEVVEGSDGFVVVDELADELAAAGPAEDEPADPSLNGDVLHSAVVSSLSVAETDPLRCVVTDPNSVLGGAVCPRWGDCVIDYIPSRSARAPSTASHSHRIATRSLRDPEPVAMVHSWSSGSSALRAIATRLTPSGRFISRTPIVCRCALRTSAELVRITTPSEVIA